jgi:hypothetical protein
MGSLTGAVTSKRVTEVRNGSLSPDGNRTGRVFAQVSLTVRLTSRAGRKLGESDLVSARGCGITQRIKVTLGITG